MSAITLSKHHILDQSPFDSSSKSYAAITAAAKGQLETLKMILKEHREIQNQLIRVTQKQDYYTTLHYALSQNQWNVVAYLINEGADFSITNHRSDGKPERTAIEILNRKEDGLCKLILSLLELKEPIKVDALVKLLTSPQLFLRRRQEVLMSHELRHALCDKLSLKDKLLIMCCLMIGSFKHKNNETDIHLMNYQPYLEPHARINCGQMIYYASYLAKVITNEQLTKVLLQGADFNEEMQLYDPNVPEKTKKKLTIKRSQDSAKALGMPDLHQEHPINLKYLHRITEPIQVVYIVNDSGFVEHYGLLYCKGGLAQLVHINNDTDNVICENAKVALPRLQERYHYKHPASIYTGMLPWHKE